MATDHGHDPHTHGPINHETTDIDLDGVGKITLGFVLFMALVVGAMYATFQLFSGRDAAGQRAVGPMVEQTDGSRPAMTSAPNAMESMGRVPAGPKLLTNEPMALQEYKDGQASRLNSYGWVDRAASVVHLPITRAIELTVERGLPVASEPESAPMVEAAASPAAQTPAPNP